MAIAGTVMAGDNAGRSRGEALGNTARSRFPKLGGGPPPIIPVFGSEYNYGHEPAEITTSTAAWKSVMVVDFVLSESGIFRAAWSTEVDSNGTYIGLRLRHRQGGVGPWDVLAMGEVTAGALHDPHAGIVVGLSLNATTQEFEIAIQSGGPPVQVGARRTRLDVWRVSELVTP